jgi:hypothetical protein
MDEGCTQPLSSDPKIKLEYHGSCLYLDIPFMRNLHKLESLTPYIIVHNQNRSKGGGKNTHKSAITTTTHTKAKTRVQQQNNRVTSKKCAQIFLESLNGVVAKS